MENYRIAIVERNETTKLLFRELNECNHYYICIYCQDCTFKENKDYIIENCHNDEQKIVIPRRDKYYILFRIK